MRQKSDYDYCTALIDFIGGFKVKRIYIDPSAASLKQELRRNGIYNAVDAKNDVLPGIRFQAQLISNGTYKICANCTETLKEYRNYLWDSKASSRGEDKPIKQNDQSMDAQSYALYTHFFNKKRGPEFTEEDAELLERMYR
jgi:phage terminase large subunit